MKQAAAGQFQQIHIDVARNSTDDFNPFHDPHRYDRVPGNPYAAPIVLGFQLECLCADLVEQARAGEGGTAADDPPFRSFQFNFAGALLRGEDFTAEVKPTVRRGSPPAPSNRVVIRKAGRPILLGQVRDTDASLLPEMPLPEDLPDLRRVTDRSFVPGTPYFLKRKWLTTANAKNFLTGSLIDQADYFDELDDKIRFPELFPCALASCALLEKAWSEGHDFMADPMVYVAHVISVDRALADALRSNDMLHMLVRGPTHPQAPKGRSGSELRLDRYHCFGYLAGERLLYRAQFDLAPLRAVVAAQRAGGAGKA